MKKFGKFIVIVVLLLVTSSCETHVNYLDGSSFRETPIVCTQIEQRGNVAKYCFTTRRLGSAPIIMYEEIGMYNVGDTVRIVNITNKNKEWKPVERN